MNKRLFFILMIGTIACLHTLSAQQKPWIDFNRNNLMDVYENPDADVDTRTCDLLSKMTVEEKIMILNEVSPAIPRLGIAKYDYGNEALHGVLRPGKFTVFPQAIALAATWNPDLIKEVSTAISDEARGRWNELEQGKKQTNKYSDLLAFWSPTVNMARDPRWGRTPETYGEDPYLSARIGVAFVQGLQGDDAKYIKTVSTPKHFIANNEEHNRFRCKVEASEQILRNYYLPAFQALVTEAHAQSIMTAYPAVNGVPCTADKWLITDILRKEWGFNGFVVSDCAAVGNIYREHHYVDSPDEAAAVAMKAGLDLECNGYCNECYIYRDYLGAALRKGLVTEQDINGAAFHVLRTRFKLGIFDDLSLVPYNRIDPSVVGSEKHRQLALETARQSIVLLRNTGILPLDLRKTKSIAVLGINAATTEFGDYSGKPLNEPVSPLDGILRKVEGKVKVNTLPWAGALSQHEIIPPEYFFHSENGKLKPGLKAEYFSDAVFKNVFSTVTETQVLFDPANRPPDANIPPSPMSVRWSGVLKPKVSGVYTVGIDKANLFRLTIDGKKCFDNNSGERGKHTLTLELVAGKAYDMVVEYANQGGNYSALLWKTPGMEKKQLYAAEKKLAKASDVAIVVLGINRNIEKEGRDRDKIVLPDDQESFIREIYKANPRTVLVLIAGSQLAIPWEQEHLPGIVNAWYPGEQGGAALADVLFGDCNPGGRLPLTYYASLDELPAFDDYQVTNGRTYMYFTGKTVYPFGYGLSYTTFEYSNLRIDKPSVTVGETLSVTVDVKNTGTRDGDEVVQFYLKSPSSGEVRPVRQLKGFRRIRLNKGEMQTVRFDLDRNALSYWNKDNLFVIDSGVYEVQTGASSEDIRQKGSFSIK